PWRPSTYGSRELVRVSERNSPAVLTTAPRATAHARLEPPTARAMSGKLPVVKARVSTRPVASAAATGSTYAAVITGSAMKSEALNARSGARVSPSTVAGVSQPEKFHMTTASPTPSPAPSVRPSARNGVHGATRAVARLATTRATTGKSATAARTTAARPTGRTPSTLSAVSTTTNAAASSQRSAAVIAGAQKRAYSTNSAGWTPQSTTDSSHDHRPTWKAQNGPNARAVHVT